MTEISFNTKLDVDYEELLKKKFRDTIKKLEEEHKKELEDYNSLLNKLYVWFFGKLKNDRESEYKIWGSGYHGTEFQDYQRFALEAFSQELLSKGYKSEIREVRDWDEYMSEPNASYLVLKINLIFVFTTNIR